MKVLTFDIEDWFNILNSEFNDNLTYWHGLESRLDMGVEYLTHLKDEMGFQATAFTVGWFAENHPQTILKLENAGFEIASHTYSHRRLDTMNAKDVKQEISNSVDIIENLIGKKINGFRAPGFSMNLKNAPVVVEAMLEKGLSYSSSIFPGYRLVGGVNNFKLIEPFNWVYEGEKICELPISVTNGLLRGMGYSGGAYFRLLPKRYLKNKFRMNQKYLMTYFHPRDFDEHQPRIDDITYLQSFLAYYGLKSSRSKFEYLIRDISWLNCANYVELVENKNMRDFNL